MGFSLILVIILSLVVLFLFIYLTSFFVKLKLEIFQFFPILCFLSWLWSILLLGQRRCGRARFEFGVVIGVRAAIFVAVKVSIYSFFILFGKLCWRSFSTFSVFCSLIGDVTFVTA